MNSPGLPDEEIARLRRRLREDPRSTVFVALAEAQRRAGRTDEAHATLRAGLRLHPDHAPARVVLARVHVDLKRRDLAISVLEEVAQSDPNNVSGLGLLARLYLDAGRTRDAAPLVERLEMASDPQAAALRASLSAPGLGELSRSDLFDVPALIDRWEARGELARARRAWTRLMERNPGHEGVRRRLDLVRALERGDATSENDLPPGERAPLPGQADLEAVLEEESDLSPAPRGASRYGALARALWRSA